MKKAMVRQHPDINGKKPATKLASPVEKLTMTEMARTLCETAASIIVVPDVLIVPADLSGGCVQLILHKRFSAGVNREMAEAIAKDLRRAMRPVCEKWRRATTAAAIAALQKTI